MTLPKEDRSYGTRQGMREQILHLLGGRVPPGPAGIR